MKILPEFFKSVLWSSDFSKVDPEKEKKMIIVQAVNYGDLDHWRWISDTYGAGAVREILSSIPATEIRDRVRRLAGVLFRVDHWNYAPLGTH